MALQLDFAQCPAAETEFFDHSGHLANLILAVLIGNRSVEAAFPDG
jgi:hypothetical protein